MPDDMALTLIDRDGTELQKYRLDLIKKKDEASKKIGLAWGAFQRATATGLLASGVMWCSAFHDLHKDKKRFRKGLALSLLINGWDHEMICEMREKSPAALEQAYFDYSEGRKSLGEICVEWKAELEDSKEYEFGQTYSEFSESNNGNEQ